MVWGLIMFKRILLLTLSVLSLNSPSSAGQFVDERHQTIIRAAQRSGIRYEVNPSDCQRDVDGFYTGDRLVVCQDYGSRGGPERKWTNNDLDTLRHEATHLAQDCRDGAIDMMIDPPSDAQVDAMIDRLGADRMLKIWTDYHNRRLYMEGILIELEAFHNARYNSPESIAQEITTYCPRLH